MLIYGPCYSSNGAYAITLDQQEAVLYNASTNAYSAPNVASVAGSCLRYMSPPLSPDHLHYVNMANATSIAAFALPAQGQAKKIQQLNVGSAAAKAGLPISGDNVQGMTVFIAK